ncbi:LOW QUALITY PROTEIN: hypothetical protein Cgig2_028936 [Carnegiea gigantea]|uniref:PGG domain-containing protein n=1 Tax=Carnegiea gigantea TaxID=171969 RepID=A0A9Q1KS51_9CARY|nr:LOW QUALITY PROTEIN: hypothetical protein Cgig2_028936 [Carnegiea gigantea]
MDDCAGDDPYYSIFVIALRRGFRKVILKFWESAPNWHTFDKRVLACALGPAPNCSDEIFRLVLEQNLQVIKDRNFYRIWSPLASWPLIGKLYPFEYVLKQEVCVTDLRRYIVDMISEENPLYYVALSDFDEDRGIQIATILVDAWKKETEQLNAVKVELPWFARRRNGGTVLHAALQKRREKVALHFLSLEKIELFLREGDKFLFHAIDYFGVVSSEKASSQSDQLEVTHIFNLHIYVFVKHIRFSKQLYPELMKQTDDDGVTVLHSWMEIRDRVMGIPIFASLLEQKTDDKSWNPLHVAAVVGANGVIEDIVRFVLEAITEQNLNLLCCSAIEDKDIKGNTAVDIALSTRREELTLCFLSMGIPSSCDYIFKAIDKQCHSVVKFLLGKIHEGGWAHHLQMGKQNLLHIASKCTVWSAEEDDAEFLRSSDCNVLHRRGRKNSTRKSIRSGMGANWLVELILQKDRSCILNTPSAWVEACKRGHLSSVFAFVKKSSYFMDLCRLHGETPLHHTHDVHFKEYKALLDHEFIKELKNTQNLKCETPLHVAIKSKNKDFTEILLRMDDVDPTIKDDDGKTAMELLKELCNQDAKWKNMCKIIGVDPRLRTTYIHLKADLTHMRDIISLVAALLATITFIAGFTLPGGFDSDSGEVILVKKAAFLMFLIADGYAMCTSMLVLFCITWSVVCKRQKSSLLIDRSLVLLKQSLYGTLLAFVTEVYTVIHRKSLWAAIVILVMCSLVVVIANRSILHVVIPKLIPADGRDYLQWLCCWKKKDLLKRKQKAMPPSNQSEVQEREPLNNQCQSELDSIV